ncbi:zonular occludens toxin domain-containing protein [Actinocrispum sp. NPDC049592]|uniref:zonular occludens toxin domain-containing protein n=1 Tax=Actinocrispum sp. NPDC049592 TaxID=3154835 RepID=UPI00342D2EF2
MNEEQHLALASIQFSSVLSHDEIWSPLTNHVDGLHTRVMDEIMRSVFAAKRRPRSTPIGLVLRGERGVGKTHMLGWLRQHVQQHGGSFFMPKLIDGKSFWAGAVHGIVNQLLGSDGGQLGRMLESLTELTGCGPELSLRVRGTMQIGRAQLDDFISRLEDYDPQVALECQDTLRALVLYQSKGKLREAGRSYLTLAEGDPEWGFRDRGRDAQLLFSDLSRLFALTGPVVMAVDQIDTVLAESAQEGEDLLAARLADGLMRMREETIRTIVVVACIPTSWELVANRSANSAADRFTVLDLSTAMPSARIAAAIVERHLGGLYGEIGFRPPYPTWPILPVAFDDPDVANYTPRYLLQRVSEHVRSCLAVNAVSELGSFGAVVSVAAAAAPVLGDLTALDERFARLRAEADVVTPLDPGHEDGRMSSLLNAGLKCYVLEQGNAGAQLTVDPASVIKPALHARLRRTIDEAREDEEHWSFRAIAHHNARAVQARLRPASLESGLRRGAHKRHLVVLRNTAFPSGPKTEQMVSEFEAASGVALPVSADDLRTFSALQEMQRNAPPEFLSWLAERRPAGRSQLLSQVLGAIPSELDRPVLGARVLDGPVSAGGAAELDRPVPGVAPVAGGPASGSSESTPVLDGPVPAVDVTQESRPVLGGSKPMAGRVLDSPVPLGRVLDGSIPMEGPVLDSSVPADGSLETTPVVSGSVPAADRVLDGPVPVEGRVLDSPVLAGDAPESTPVVRGSASTADRVLDGSVPPRPTELDGPVPPVAPGPGGRASGGRVLDGPVPAGEAPELDGLVPRASGSTPVLDGPVPPASELDRPVPAGAREPSGSVPAAELAKGQPAADDSAVFLGRNVENGKEFRVPLLLLRKHTVVFAGSGSGKTVLLRRLVEDAAIHGVSSILIDSNNDLARLGDRWPTPPGTWTEGDPERAERYHAGTDVVIWTPRRESGRPIALNPLPDFSGVLDDPDEFRTAVDASVAGLVRRAGLTARKVATGKAVLTQALTYFARKSGSELTEFVELLGDLPDGVSTIKDARRLAEGMAEELKAAMINDPIFGGAGERLDPGVLLTPARDKRARISVISCIGLPTDEQRQTFVNQLQLALFAWVKRNPAGDRPLGGLLVLDEAQTFVPSRGTTASTESTLKLATQARKYGLGLVYATQAPKALHNLVTGNAATQFFGLLNASVQIQAAMELARSKGGRVDDIARLPAGRFYGATEGMRMGKIEVPMCLSHHPSSALTEEEVLQRARR